MLTIVLCAALSAEPGPAPEPSRASHSVLTPVWLPRYAYAGFFLNQYAVAPNFRVGWEITVYDDSRNLLALVIELGPGFGIAWPQGATQFWEHVATGGVGYRWGKEKSFQWGFTLGIGAVLEGAIFDPPLPKGAREERVLGFAEGRLYAGWDFGPLFAGLAFGYGSPLAIFRAYPSTQWVGGFNVGLLANWR